MTKSNESAVDKFLKATSGAEVTQSIAKLLLYGSVDKLDDGDKLNLELVFSLMRQIDQEEE